MKLKLYKVGEPKVAFFTDPESGEFGEAVQQLYTNNGETEGWSVAVKVTYENPEEIKDIFIIDMEIKEVEG